MKRTPWVGAGSGHVYEHLATPPEPRTWGPNDCPPWVRVNHPENKPKYKTPSFSPGRPKKEVMCVCSPAPVSEGRAQ